MTSAGKWFRVTATAVFTLAAFAASRSLVEATTIFVTNRAVFDAANPGLTQEDFENANLASGTDTTFAPPLNSSTNNSVFATGSVKPGFSLEPTFGDVYVSRDFGGNTSANVSSNFFAADINILFAPTVTAIGIDLEQWEGNNGGWTVQVYDSADVLLGSFSTAAGSFVGITSTDQIARLFLDKPDSGAVVDNLEFGAAVPEPTSILLLGTGLLAARGWRKRRPTV